MCGVSDNQAIKTKCMEIIITNKSRKQREKERENTRICLPSSVQIDLVWGREQPSARFTIMMSNFTKEISMSYKNKL